LNKNTYKDEEKTTNYLIWGSLYFAQSKMLNYNDIQLRLTAIASWRRSNPIEFSIALFKGQEAEAIPSNTLAPLLCY
ncbi:MAG: hypothetical protein K9H26_18520, partial [Prolixibacteraceae bacterium]|nr:hypothetical protein [Prolixibacteraceae bacterium]